MPNTENESWKDKIPQPICEDAPEYDILYKKAFELAHDHIKHIDGMPQSPYMDEAFCDTQIWIWDTCFMSLFCKYARDEFPGIESLKNFYDVLYGDKKLPLVTVTEREPDFTGAKAGEKKMIDIHIADNPPLFAFAEYENALFHGDKEYIRDLLYNKCVLQKHFYWIENLKESTLPRGVFAPTCLIKENIGYRWEGGRSGMDNTPRGKEEDRTEKERPNNPNMLWVDAICQQALSSKLIAELFTVIGDSENADTWKALYNEKKDIINRFYWDSEDSFYYDINLDGSRFYKVMTPASFWALVAGVASKKQAREMISQISNEHTLGGIVPLISLSRSDGNYEKNGKYWRGALWLPTAYASLKGIANYGYYEEAHRATEKILNHMLKTYREYTPHTIWECYSPEACEPSVTSTAEDIVRADFCGWSALGPISMYIEYYIGIYYINAFDRVVKWHKSDRFTKKIGIKNLRFADVVTDIIAEGDKCTVVSNATYTLIINDKPFEIAKGENIITI